MRRRDFMLLVGGATVSLIGRPLLLGAQPKEPVRRVGVLMALAKEDPENQVRVVTLCERLRELGWSEGHNVQFDYRWYAGEPSRALASAKELIDLRPDVMLVAGSAGVAAIRETTHAVPVVFLAVVDPVSQGFVESMARPGGNLTGFALFEFSLGGKVLAALKEVAPRVSRVAIMFDPESSSCSQQLQSVRSVAPSFAVEIIEAPVRDEAGIKSAMAALARQPDSGLMLLADAYTIVHRDLIVELAAHYRLPAIYAFRLFVAGGGLLSYGVDMVDLYRRAATYLDRILKGVKPADLPIQQPIKYEMAINLKAAADLGLEVPQMLLARADEVIE